MTGQDSRLIISLAAILGGSGMLYFLGLVLGLPLILILILVIVSAIALFRAIYRHACPAMAYRPIHIAILATGTFLITNRTFYLATKWGDWDAWGIWNYHAKFLAYPRQWTNLFRSVQYDHPDYPLGIPSLLAFFCRIFGRDNLLHISFGLHFLITLMIPVLIFLVLYRKQIWVATAVLLLFATDEFYLERGVSQYADTALAAFFLMAIISIREAPKDPRMAGAAVFFAGCAAWTKNEGIVLALMLGLFYAKDLLTRRNRSYTLLGLALPLTTIIIFKAIYAPANDLFHNTEGNLLNQVIDPDRYNLVWNSFKGNCTEHFAWVVIAFLCYLAGCLFQKRSPEKVMVLILVCLAIYMLTYILTPYDIAWHLNTSQDRLMHELMPALVYAIALRFSELKLQGIKNPEPAVSNQDSASFPKDIFKDLHTLCRRQLNRVHIREPRHSGK